MLARLHAAVIFSHQVLRHFGLVSCFAILVTGSPALGKVPAETGGKRVLRHAVFFKFKESANETDVATIVKAFEWGTNTSPEGLNDGFTHCFLVTFDSEEGRATYLPHDDHKAFVKVLQPVVDKVRVLDFWAN